MSTRFVPFWSTSLSGIVLSLGALMLAGCGDRKAASQIDSAIYPPNAVWSGLDPPLPSYLMHQLPGLDNQKFPLWDGKLFAAKVSDTLAAGVQRN